jgi:hypothetical protein
MKNILLKNHFLFNSVNFSIFIDGHNWINSKQIIDNFKFFFSLSIPDEIFEWHLDSNWCQNFVLFVLSRIIQKFHFVNWHIAERCLIIYECLQILKIPTIEYQNNLWMCLRTKKNQVNH